MDQMQQPVPAAPAQPMPQPVMPVQPQPVQPMMPQPAYAGGGQPLGGPTDFFRGVQVGDVVVIGLTIAAFCFIIYAGAKHIRYIRADQKKKEDIRAEVDELKENFRAFTGDQYPTY